MSSTPALPPQTEGDFGVKITRAREMARAAMPVESTVAAAVAKECLSVGFECSKYQNDRTEVSAGWMSKITAALISAGNVLHAADKIDPAGAAPAGWTKKTEFAPDGRMVVTFEQEVSPPAQPQPLGDLH